MVVIEDENGGLARTATLTVHDNQFDTRIPKSVTKRIIADYNEYLIGQVRNKILELQADLFSPDVIMYRRTAFLNCITIIQEGDKYARPYVIPAVSQMEVNDLVSLDSKPPQTSSNPPNPTSINEILEGFKVVERGGKPVEDEGGIWLEDSDINDLKTALYTLIASKAPKKSFKAQRAYRIHSNDFAAVVKEKARNQALQDYDNAIKEIFDRGGA